MPTPPRTRQWPAQAVTAGVLAAWLVATLSAPRMAPWVARSAVEVETWFISAPYPQHFFARPRKGP